MPVPPSIATITVWPSLSMKVLFYVTATTEIFMVPPSSLRE